jgi:hypothetical protein
MHGTWGSVVRGWRYKGNRNEHRKGPVVIFKLKKAVNVDELLCVQFFEYKRIYTKQRIKVEDIIGCNIRSLRSHPMVTEYLIDSSRDYEARIVKIESCEICVPREEILAWLELYGNVESELVEDCFKDEDDYDGTNITGNYSVKVKLTQEILQWLPMSGRRIKIYYKGTQELYTNGFRRIKIYYKGIQELYTNGFCNYTSRHGNFKKVLCHCYEQGHSQEYFGKSSEIIE